MKDCLLYTSTGVQIYEGFGQTETTMTLGTFPWIKPKPGSMGKPNPCLLYTSIVDKI